MDEALIVVSIISSIGMLAGIQLLNHNWFKKENWKFKRDQTRKIDAINLKALERKLFNQKAGISDEKTPSQGNLDISSILKLAKNLEPDQLQAILGGLTGGEETEGGALEGILNNLPPELIESFLKGLNKGKEESEDKPKIVFEG